MSLCSLRKSQPSAKPVCVSVNDFINQAIDYANGERAFIQHGRIGGTLVAGGKADPLGKHKKHATFSLSEEAIAQLSTLSERTGISRSRLIRILIDQQLQTGSDSKLIQSNVL